MTGLDEQQALRGQMRDVAALVALPAMWRGREPPDIACSLLDVLTSILRVDLAYVRLDRAEGAPAFEDWRPHGQGPPRELVERVEARLATADASVTAAEPNPCGSGVLQVDGVSLGEAGLVVVGSRRADFPTEPERFLLNVAAEQAAIAVDIARSLRRERAARAAAEAAAETLETINRIGQLLAAELELQRLVQAVTDAATELAGAEFGAFFYNVVNQQGESYLLYTLSGAPKEAFAQFPLPRATELFGPTFRGEEVVRLDDVTKDPRYGQNPPYHGKPPGHLPVVSYLAVPVISRSGEILGGLFFGHSQPGVFTERAESIVVGLAAQAAVAMDNARLYQEMRLQVEAHVQLNADLRETAEARDRALAELQQLLRTRDEFLASAAHDLKTPLANIKGRAQLLRRRATRSGTPEAAQVAQGLESIEASTTRMVGLVDELLDTARLQLGQPLELDRRRTDLVALARRAAAEHQQTAERHQIRVEAAVPELVGVWDVERLERVLANLLENAIKYSPRGGEVLVSVGRQHDSEGDWAVVAVRDHGLGIPAEDLPHVLDRFHRARNVGRIGGTGIGLSGVRYIVESHGGRIGVESQEDMGSSFTVRLPRGIAETDAANPAG